MLRVFASLVIGFFVLLWVTGNDVNSFRQKLLHWADGNAEGMSGSGYASDWGR